MFATLSFVFQILIGQVPNLITGIPGIGYAFTIVYSIIQTVTWLLYQGRRWRIFTQGLLTTTLVFLGIPSWTLFTSMVTISNMFIVDLVFNSFYEHFKRKNTLYRWIFLAQVYYWTAHPLLFLPFSTLFYPFERFLNNWFIPIMSVMLPIMIIEAIAGSYIGYKIYRRVERLAYP
jgi:hypothetical protein